MSDSILLNDDELENVAGGKAGGKKKPKKTDKKCHQCQMKGKMSEAIYRLGDYEFCKEGFHIYKNGVYSHSSKSDVLKLLDGKKP